MKRVLSALFLISFCASIVLSCQKEEVLSSVEEIDNLNSVKEWVNTNGGLFSKHTLIVELTNGSKQTGDLNWDRVRKFRRGQYDFLQVPFYFTLPNQPPGSNFE